MPRSLSLFLIMFQALAPLMASEAQLPARNITLAQAYELSLKRSEELAQRGETVAQLEARITELWSYAKPQLSVGASELLQDVPAGTSFRRNQQQAQLQLHQTLFTGLREYLSVRQAKVQKASAEYALLRARQLLYQDAGQAYLNLLSVRHQLAIQRVILETTDERIKELRERQRLGRSRKSELLAAQSQRAQVAAQIETARGAETVAQLQLRFLTGLDEDLDPAELLPAANEALDRCLTAARNRPDVEGARRDVDAAGYPITILRRRRWPSADVDGNYYLYRPPGSYKNVDWDATFSLQLPLYTGGGIGAQVRQAQAQKRSAQEALSLAMRRAELQVRSAYRNLDSSLSIVTALVEAVRLAEENAKAQADDYRSGLVTNLDVLGSISALQQTRLTLDQAKIQSQFARIQLEVSAGLSQGGS